MVKSHYGKNCSTLFLSVLIIEKPALLYTIYRSDWYTILLFTNVILNVYTYYIWN